MDNNKKKFGLILRLLVAIILGILIGKFLPEPIVKSLITISTIFSSFLKFIIPFMILAFITMGIADLTQGAGKLLITTALISYISTLIAGTLAYLVGINFFPLFINDNIINSSINPEQGMLSPFFKIPLDAPLDVTAAIVLAFIFGLSISIMKNKEINDNMYNFFDEFAKIINKVLEKIIIPLLPIYIMGTFANMTYSGQVFSILSVLWKIFIIIILLHILYIITLFIIAAVFSKKNALTMLKNQVPAYLTALGTQSSVATIPINLNSAEKNGVSKEIREFVIPLCANIHLAGSMITITCCVTSVLLMNNMEISLIKMVPFILALGVAMIASPGAPGGGIMSALPFLPIIGIAEDSSIASLLIALYLTQDSFGTACNVSGDNAIALFVDKIYKKFIRKD